MSSLTPHQLLALDYKKHISLAANAGSGKTFVLAKRYLEIALSENLPLRNIAAITFTDKAASELYRKIAGQIDEKLRDKSNKKLEKKLENIRRQLVSANISTVHSFCIDILREYPVEGNLDANFIPIDERLSTELIELSVEEMVKKALNDSDSQENIKYLIRIFTSKSLLTREIILLIKNRKTVLGMAEGTYSKTEDEITDFLFKSFLKYADKLFLSDKTGLLKAFEDINSVVLGNNKTNELAVSAKLLIEKLKTSPGVEKNILLLKELSDILSTKSGGVKIQGYLKKNIREDYREQIDLIEKFFTGIAEVKIENTHKEIEKELAKFGKTFLGFFQKALYIYENKKKEGGYLDYEDILLSTQLILTNKEVRSALTRKYKYIMIDEYQDTNETQYNIFIPILGYLKKGNLFVVGDEKQSIYMFRDAALEVFERTKNEIALLSGKESLLSLPDSFRMAPALCLFTNYLFKNLFAKPNPLFNEVSHSDIVCARNDGLKGRVELLIAGEVNGEESSVNNAEAELVAKRILKLVHSDKLEQPVNWGDVAVLCRKRKYFTELEEMFIKHKIPFSIMGGKGFFQRQTIYDIFNYFSFMLDETNDTSLVGILRSPFFSVSDSTIFEISLQPGGSFWQKLKSYAAANSYFTNVVKILNENLLLAKSYDITSLLRKIIRQSDLMAVLASKQNGAQELVNIEKLIKLTATFSSQGFKTLYDYVSFLKDSIEQTEDEAQAAVAEESNSVKIMTFHQAKGLEFPAVFLFKCSETFKKDSVKSKSVSISKDFGILTKIPVKGDYFSEYEEAPVIGINNIIIKRKSLAEIKRLFYVGITRAINYLFISAQGKTSMKYSSDSFIGMLIEGLNIDLNEKLFTLNHSLKYLHKKGDTYLTEEKNIEIEIPIIKEIENTVETEPAAVNLSDSKIIDIDKLIDIPEGEIISATKVSVYKQCPVKYQLTYDYGFTKLNLIQKRWGKKYIHPEANIKDYEFTPNEEERISYTKEDYSTLKGRVIHKILQKEITQDEVEQTAVSLLRNELNIIKHTDKLMEQIKTSLLNDLAKYYLSNAYQHLKSFNNFKNEYEIYVKEFDYYLYGIIDKLIFDNNNFIIVDYKTDDISREQIHERAVSYFNQLKFYSYIVSRYFKNIASIKLRLVFIKHPDENIVETIKESDINNIKIELSRMVENIRNTRYSKNHDHCKSCLFSLKNNSCIKNY